MATLPKYPDEQPQPTPPAGQPGHPGYPGQRARSTWPLRIGDHQRIHSGDLPALRLLQVDLFEPCRTCGGKGHIGVSQPFCLVCHQAWTQAQFDHYLLTITEDRWRHFRRFKRLPCTHAAKYLSHTNPVCTACFGSGGEHYRVSLTWLARVLDRILGHAEQNG